MKPPRGEWPPVVHAILDGVRTDDWTRIDAAWCRVREPRHIYLRRDTSPDDYLFLRDAVLMARGGGFLDDFVLELLASGALDAPLAKAVLDGLGRPGWHLEAFQNGVYLMRDAVLASDDQRAACDYVCRIDINDVHRGTGVLVRPTLVATAAHVIWDLVAKRPDGSPDLMGGLPRMVPGSQARISLTFGDANVRDEDEDQRVCRREGEVAPIASDWLGWASAPADADPVHRQDVTDVSGIHDVDGPWDIALIRLETPWGKRTARLLDADPPERPFEVQILHHPNGNTAKGQPLTISGGQLYRHLPAWPPVRCLHSAATSEGSSGAPVFDRSWHVVAVHQGGAQPGSKGGRGDGHNRAIPVRPWLARVDMTEQMGPAGVPRLAWLKTARDLVPYPYPVIGRGETQRRVYQALRPGATPQQRLLIVRGEPGTGLRFTGRLVREIVTAHGDGVVAELDTANAPQDPVGVVNWIANALSAQVPEDDQPPLKTGNRTVRDDLVPALGQRLEELAGSARSVWIVLIGPGGPPDGIPPAVSGVVSELIGQLSAYPAVRLILAGWAQAPPGFADSEEKLSPPTAMDVAWHLSPAGQEPGADIVKMVSSLFQYTVNTHAFPDYPTARMVADQLRPLVAQRVRATLGEEADRDRAGA
jgi:hypothetical protein